MSLSEFKIKATLGGVEILRDGEPMDLSDVAAIRIDLDPYEPPRITFELVARTLDVDGSFLEIHEGTIDSGEEE